MTDLSGKLVQFHLSPGGRTALRGLIPARGSIRAYVVGTTDLGPLVQSPASAASAKGAIPLMLLRWDHIATLTFDYEFEGQPAQRSIGFRSA